MSKRARKVLRLLAKVIESDAKVVCLSSESSDLLKKARLVLTLIFSFFMSRLMVLNMYLIRGVIDGFEFA